MTPLLASLDIFKRATLPRLRQKSLALTSFLRECLAIRLAERVSVLTPADAESHGSQLSLSINANESAARRVRQHLAAAHVACDWREPNVLRVAPAPLYNAFVDVWRFVDSLSESLA